MKWTVRKCRHEGIRAALCTGWKTTDPNGYVSSWGSWERAMLRATKGW